MAGSQVWPSTDGDSTGFGLSRTATHIKEELQSSPPPTPAPSPHRLGICNPDTYVRSGTNSQGNVYCVHEELDPAKPGCVLETYHYYNLDGSTYHMDGRGHELYWHPDKNGWYRWRPASSVAGQSATHASPVSHSGSSILPGGVTDRMRDCKVASGEETSGGSTWASGQQCIKQESRDETM
ncbi:hypothetical protein LTR85_002410 [Meristemomyces frigidus]|nr:hypothetical protein LTR85_002410 [Meristemomyces frigidus]